MSRSSYCQIEAAREADAMTARTYQTIEATPVRIGKRRLFAYRCVCGQSHASDRLGKQRPECGDWRQVVLMTARASRQEL